MGYCITQIKENFQMDVADREKALASLRKGVKNSYDKEAIKDKPSLEEAMLELCWDLESYDGATYSNILFNGEKYHSDLIDPLNAIAPYVKEGSYVSFVGEEGDVFTFLFKDGSCQEIDGLPFLSEPDPSKEAIKKAEQILIDNGIEADEVQTVLQAVGYALLNKELYAA